MVRFTAALAACLATSAPTATSALSVPTTAAFQFRTGARAHTHTSLPINPQRHASTRVRSPAPRRWSTDHAVSSTSNDYNDYDSVDPEQILSSVTTAARDAFQDQPDAEEAEFLVRQQRVAERQKVKSAASDNAYTVSLSADSTRGIRLAQVYPGRRLGEQYLDLDTLQMTALSLPEKRTGAEFDFRAVDDRRQAVVVVHVDPDGQAYQQGVRIGDILQRTSATLGKARWPQSTLEGVRSAVSSRRGSVSLELLRAAAPTTVAAAESTYELTLTRPLGMELKDTRDGYVEITGFTESAPRIVRYAVQVGDRILAVDSSLGDKLWPVSTVEGVISSITARFPGQKITMRFLRPAATDTPFADNGAGSVESMNAAALFASSTTTPEAIVSADAVDTVTPIQQTELLERCRGVIKRYTINEKSNFVEKYDVPVLVADRVMEALANVETTVDSVTLSMIMTAYLSCKQPQAAIAAFEACTGLAADGSDRPVVFVKDDSAPKQISPSPASALDAFTISSLLKAHAISGDLESVRRVLVASKGRAGSIVNGLPTAAWPGTGIGGAVAPDTRCYNIAIKATAALTEDSQTGLKDALKIFNAMGTKTSSLANGDAPEKDLVTYNTLLLAFANAGNDTEAFDLFYKMKQSGVKPDKITYTSLLKACTSDIDKQELLYDMKERGIKPDVVMYNSLIRSLCEKNEFVEAKDMISEMERSGLAPNSMTYGTIMSSLLKAGNPSACITLFETACQDSRTVGLTENVYLYTIAMTAAAKLKDHERALDLLSRMSALGIKPDIKTLTALMGACIAAGKPELAVDVFSRIAQPDGRALSQGLRAMCQAGQPERAFENLVAEVSSKRQAAKPILKGKELLKIYESMLSESLGRNDFSLARKIMRDIFHTNHMPSKGVYETIFSALGIIENKTKPESVNTRYVGADEHAQDKFSFLLFLMDLVQNRNMPVGGPLYGAILRYANTVGGVARKIGSLLVFTRGNNDNNSGSGPLRTLLMDVNAGSSEEARARNVTTHWEEMFLRYDLLKSQVQDPTELPPLWVQISSRDTMSILRSEQSYSSSAARNRRRKMV